MHRPRPNKLHDELDALLDGRPVELTDELAPLAEAADSLRAELATYQLDPGVANRHLERVLEGSGTVVQLPVRRPAGGWEVRRRVVAVALAAALVLAPATIASAAALPGQAMYPFKLAIEQLRIASVQWSSTREAGERTRVADERLSELKRLVELQMFNQVGPAVTALAEAVRAAKDAVDDAKEEGAAGSEVARLTGKLVSVQNQASRTVVMVSSTIQAAKLPSGSTRDAIEAAVQDAQGVLPPPQTPPGTATPTPTPTTANSPATSPPTDPPTDPTNTPPATPPSTTPTTVPPTTVPPTTVPPTTSTPTSEPATPGSADDKVGDSGQAGADERAPAEAEAIPPTTAP
ncbi:MAG TPA: DUF5667 domain-containing protein [Actinomycetota bacterium]